MRVLRDHDIEINNLKKKKKDVQKKSHIQHIQYDAVQNLQLTKLQVFHFL